MTRGQWIALGGGATLGLIGVAAGVVLARREGREAASRLMAQYGAPLAEQAKQLGSQVASAAVEQYQAQKPRAVEAWNTYVPQAREAATALVGALPLGNKGEPQA